MNDLTNWLAEHSWLVSMVATLSVTLLAVTVLATPWVLSKLPPDYLQQQANATPATRSLGRSVLMLFRGVAGLLIFLLGLIMMVTPGPGLITLLLGISIAEFPGKSRLFIYLATRPNVLASLNWMRRRYDKPPFTPPTSP